MFNFINNMSQTEILLILVLILLFFFGGTVVRKLARTSGGVVGEVKKVKKAFTDAIDADDTTSK